MKSNFTAKKRLVNCQPTWDSGFTLIEMLVVLVILVLSMLVVMPNFRSSNSARMGLMASQIVAELNAARIEAITKNQTVACKLSPDRRSFSCDQTRSKIALPSSVHLVFHPTPGGRFAQRDDRLVFFPSGSSTGGLVVLSNSKQSVSMRVEWATGAVSREVASR